MTSTSFITERHSFEVLPRRYSVLPLLMLPRISFGEPHQSEQERSYIQKNTYPSSHVERDVHKLGDANSRSHVQVAGMKAQYWNRNFTRSKKLIFEIMCLQFVIFWWLTSTPLGTPVVPVKDAIRIIRFQHKHPIYHWYKSHRHPRW